LLLMAGTLIDLLIRNFLKKSKSSIRSRQYYSSTQPREKNYENTLFTFS
jgi:hypothetical protein